MSRASVSSAAARRFWELAFIASFPRAQRRADELSSASTTTPNRAALAVTIARAYADAAVMEWRKLKLRGEER